MEPVSADENRDVGAIDSALMAPFQTFLGQPLVPEIERKGARLFHSLIANHPFDNGNKRTAILALDSFFVVNSRYLALGGDAIHRLAMAAASYREQGVNYEEMLVRIDSVLQGTVILFGEFDATTRAALTRNREELRSMSPDFLRRM